MDDTQKQIQRGKQMRKFLIIIAVTVGLILVAIIGRADSIIPQDKPRGYTTGTIIDHYERISDIVEIKDKGAIGGAIIGGLATQNRRQSDTIQYKEISSCRDVPRYKIVTKDDYSHSTINFTLDGISYNARFIKHGL